MRSTVVAILLLFSTSAMAATYIPVHTAPVVHVNPVADQNSGSLNPRFVEQLMGFEIDHTDLKDLGIAASPSKPTRSSKRSRKPKAS